MNTLNSNTFSFEKSKLNTEHFLFQFLPASRTDISFGIKNLADLVFAEEILDDLESMGLAGNQAYFRFRGLVCTYVYNNPALFLEPWLRNGGAVFDIIENARQDYLEGLLDDDEDLKSPKLDLT
jgi:hypothetical protein